MTAADRDHEGRAEVRAAAIYMDSVKPDWWTHIDPLKFNLLDRRYCICGQNGLDWNDHDSAFDAIYTGRWPQAAFAYPGLEPFWLEEIARRMPAPVGEPVREKVTA